MQWQFPMQKIKCMKQVKGEMQTQEQTQEVRLSDGMPDAGRILGVWGQVFVRSKQWQEDCAQVNCGVTVWVLYAPADGSQAQCMESWLPMTIRWDLPMEQEGNLQVHCLLKSADARILSGRKLMVRATVSADGRVYMADEASCYSPEDLPDDIHLLQKTYPVCLLRETGEKAFMHDEDLMLPETAPAADKLISYRLQPEITERKVLGDKVVFRGSTLLHILYRSEDGALVTYDFEIPFSQYAELEQSYGNDAQLQILPALTSAELNLQEQGRLRLKAGLLGQYLLLETVPVSVVEDVYSPERSVVAKTEQVQLPAVLEKQIQRIRAEQTASIDSTRVADVVFYPAGVRMQRRQDSISAEIPATFQILYYDGDGVAQCALTQWQTELNFPMEGNVQMSPSVLVTGKTQTTNDSDSVVTRAEITMETIYHTVETIPMVTEITAGEPVAKDPQRPSLILRKAGEDTLWQLAKNHGSTVEAICKANQLSAEPEPDQMLLIPVL